MRCTDRCQSLFLKNTYYKIILCFQHLFYFRLFKSGEAVRITFQPSHYLAHFPSATAHHPMVCLCISGWWSNGDLSFRYHLWVIFSPDLQCAPTAMVAFRCVAGCDSCCPSLYYSSEFCKQWIYDEGPSSVITSSFISAARVVWHRDAFCNVSTECLQICYQDVLINRA